MGSYRPPHHGYGPPPAQDPYARPGSATYGQPPPPAGLHGYGSPVTTAPPSWNVPSSQPYGGSSYTSAQAPLPPPPAGAPPTNPSPYGYQIQTVGGQTVAPVLPPRIPQPYGQSASTPPVSNYQAPPQGGVQPGPGHQRIPSVPSAYHQDVSQNSQGWPQHPQYSSQPTTHHYDPPLPPRPGTQPRPLAEEGRRYSLYAQPPPPQERPQESQYPGAPPQPPHQQLGHGQLHDSQPPTSGLAYGVDDQHAPTYYQTAGGYVPPPPPPKPQQYGVGPGYASESQPPRPASVAQPYGQQYQAPPPPGSAYPGAQPPPPSNQYSHDQSTQYPPYGGQQPSNSSAPYQQHPPPGPPVDQTSQYAHGSETPVSYSRPGSRPQAAHGYGRPPTSDEQQPVSPLQGRQSISFDRPSSTSNVTTGPQDQAALKPPKGSFAFSSDWEHFGSGADEIDDTAMYGVKKDEAEAKMASVELPASSPQHGRAGSEVSAPESFHPSPAIAPAMQHGPQQGNVPDQYAPTPPTGYPTPQPGPPHHTQHQQSVPADEADYIPPMPDTPPAARRPQRTSIVIGGSAQSQAPPPPAPSFAREGSAYQAQQPAAYAMQQAMHVPSKPTTPQPQPHLQAQAPASSATVVMNEGAWNPSQVSHGNIAPSAAPTAVFAPTVDQAQLRRAQQEAEDYKAELGHLQQELLNIRAASSGKDSIIAQRDGAIAQKDASLTQKDTEIAERTTEFNKLKAQLNEITETFAALRTSTAGLETELKAAQAGQADLRTKLEQADAAKTDVNTRLEQSGAALAALAAVSAKHESEKKGLDEKLKEAEARNQMSATELKEAQTKLESSSNEIAELKRRLDEEKAKATAKAAEPVDIAPGLDAWFKGSLERCKDMLYTESKPIPVQEKLQVFMDFVNAEARLRGIDLPFGPKGEMKGFAAPQPAAPVQGRETPKLERPRVTPPKESDDFVMVDSEADVLYSPGGRPILNAKASEEYSPGGRPILNKTRTMPVSANAPPPPEKTPSVDHIQTYVPKPTYQPFRVDTPGANASSKGSAPVQTPNIPPKPVYKPFTWNPNDPFATTSGAQAPPASSTPIQAAQEPVYKPLYKPIPAAGSVPAAETAKQVPSSAEILFDPIPGGAKPRNRTDTLKGPQDAAMLPMPLKPRTPAPPVSTTSTSPAAAELPVAVSPKVEQPRMTQKASNIEQLSSLVNGSSKRQPSKRIEDLTKAFESIQVDYGFTKTVAKSFEDKAAVTRSKLAKERAHRQAEIEKRNNELFDNGEIGYGDLETLEGQAKEDELRSKAEEDSQEYNEYQKEVFDVVYKRCHEDIGALVNLQTDVEALLRKAGAGQNVVSADNNSESLSQGLQLLLKIHEKLDLVHGEATKAIQERDRKFKLTQTKPLYAAGDIAAMKRVEKACEEAEKKSDVRARVERAERCKRLHRIVDTEMERGAGENEDFAADVIAAAEDTVSSFKESEKDRVLVLLSDATKAISLVYEDTLLLMQSFSHIDAQLNECEYEVSLASARLKGDPKDYFDRLENEKKREDGKLKADEEKRSAAVKDHQKEAEGLLKGLVEKAKEGVEERDARERKERALEEARRRNGEM